MPYNYIGCLSVHCLAKFILSVFLKASFMHLFDHFCALSRCKRIGVQLKVGITVLLVKTVNLDVFCGMDMH